MDAFDEFQVLLTKERVFTRQFLELVLKCQFALHED